MQTSIFLSFIFLAGLVSPFSRPCSSCATYGCCNVWYQCAASLSSCAYYIGYTKSESEIGTPCYQNSDCTSGCCSNFVCASESICKNPTVDDIPKVVEATTCDQCTLGCCDSYKMCATDTNSCAYYIGDVATFDQSGDAQTLCYAYQCATGCCVGNLCAETEEECGLPNWKVFMLGALVFFTCLFILIAFTVRYLYNDKQKALYQETRRMILNKQIIGPKGLDPLKNAVHNPNKIEYSQNNVKSHIYDV